MANPVISNLDGDTITFVEDGAALRLDIGTAAGVSDSDTEDFTGATLTISIAGALPEDILSIDGQGGISARAIHPDTQLTVFYGNPLFAEFIIGKSISNGSDGTSLIIELRPDPSVANPDPITAEKVAALIQSISYRNVNAADPSGSTRQITFTLDDGNDGSASVTTTVNIVRMNDAPTIDGPLGEPIYADVSGAAGMPSNGEGFHAVVSGNGKYALFSSDAGNLVPGTTPGTLHVYRKDLETGAITLVSAGLLGVESNGESRAASISEDGRYVAFSSEASNLVADDLNGAFDIFLWDANTGQIRLVSADLAGVQGNAGSVGDHRSVRVTSDGQFVVFISDASNLVSGDTANTEDVFVKNMITGVVTRASVNANGEVGDNALSSNNPFYFSADISDDGRFVVLETNATNMVPDYDRSPRGSFSSDIYLKDLQTGAVHFVSESRLHPGAAQSGDLDFGSDDPSVSADGRYVLFNPGRDIVSEPNALLLWDRLTGDVRDIATTADGAPANESVSGVLSRGGVFAALMSRATNLTPDSTQVGVDKVFVKNLVTGEIVFIGLAEHSEAIATVSDDGRVILYVASDDYAPGDTDGLSDIYVAYRDGTGGIPVIEDVPSPVLGVSFDDIDAGDGEVTAILTAASGTLFQRLVDPNVEVTQLTARSFSFAGTVDAINAYLAAGGLEFLTELNATANVALTVTIDDGGNTGTDPGISGTANSEAAAATFMLVVTPINDAPTITGNGGIPVTENTPSPVKGFTFDDVDAGSSPVAVTFTVDRGTLGAVPNGSVTVSNATGLSIMLTGPLADINAFLAQNRLVYTTALNDETDVPILVRIDDNGHSGFGGDRESEGEGLVAEEEFTLVVTPIDEAPGVNGAPVNGVPGTQELEANVPAAIAGLSVTDDSGAGIISTTLSLQFGILTLAGNGGATIADNGTDTVTITGTLAQVNAALAGNNVVYSGPVDFFGTDTLTMLTNDNGNTGSGGPLTDTDQVTIHLNTFREGTNGDDSFEALPGNAFFVARPGTDTITFDFALTEATIAWRNNLVIIDGPSSHTVLSGFETYVFTDGTVHNADGDRLVDDLFYYARYHDVWNAGTDADAHYRQTGWHEGRDPNAFFDTDLYLATNPDVRAGGSDPLLHYDLFGWREGRIASPNFDAAKYNAFYQDVAAAGRDPLEHFLRHGAEENRLPFAANTPLAANGFDFAYYLLHNPDVAAAGVDPREHFETTGWKEGRNPNALFDVNGYLAHYGDVAAAGINPLDHYHQTGWREGRDPSVDFDTSAYLAAYPDVAAANRDPLAHYLQFGIHENRSAFADGVWG